MTTLYLSLVDQTAAERRAELDALIKSDPDMADPGTAGRITAWARMETTVQVDCARCGRPHDALWTISRVARDSGLYWPFVNVNGARILLDASLPTTVDRLPRDARPVSADEAARLWHDDNESHIFGGPNIAAALRAAVASANGR